MTHDMTRDEKLTEAQRQLDEFLVEYRAKALAEHAARLTVLEACVAAGALPASQLTVANIRLGCVRVPLIVEQLPLVRKHLPQLRDVGAYEAEDPEKNTVRVWLDHGVEGAKDVRLFYVKELAADSPCQYRDVTINPVEVRTVRTLVCERKEES